LLLGIFWFLKMKNKNIFFLKLLVGIILLVFLFLKVDLQEFISAFKDVNIFFLFLALISTFLGYVISSYKWKIALLSQAIKIRYTKLIESYAVSMFFGNFLPTSYGGDIVRVYDTAKISKKKVKSLSAVLFDRLVGFFVLLLIGLIASFFLIEFLSFSPLILGGMVILLSFFFLSKYKIEEVRFFKKILKFDKKNIIKRLRESIFAYKKYPKYIFLIFIFSLLLQLNVIIFNYFIALGIGLNLPLKYFFFLIPLVNIISILPFSINGLGVREFAYVYLFSLVDIPIHTALFMSLTVFFIRIVSSLPGGIVYVFRGKNGKNI